ncbi:LAFE_0A01772g1_1 [Lachancea fermentati]|uniref:LAFE_0A01772g1_1 n=2 Tax=Lachancea TaxID=300275 RepID=A0A1G4M6B3_LACFM|nr:LAFE_0A01772g1_1 [Lachancea fermentati]
MATRLTSNQKIVGSTPTVSVFCSTQQKYILTDDEPLVTTNHSISSNTSLYIMKQQLREFFGPRRLYFVCGKVYQDQSYANRLVHWFVLRNLPVVPVTPRGGEIPLANGKKSLEISKSISDGLNASELKNSIDGISVCFVTPPPITLSILQQLKEAELPVRSVWFQPGSWNMDCVKSAENDLHIEGSKVINDCILMNGHANYVKSELTQED